MPSCTEIALVSFDLDGTLVDTAGEIAEAVHRTLDDFGLARRPPDEITRLIGHGTRSLMTRLLGTLRTELPFDAVHARFEHHYAETAGQSGRPYAGCEGALERLRRAGVRLACVTNKERLHAERVLAATGLANWFPTLLAGDTLPYKKPDARVLGELLRRQGVAAPQAAHVGDSSIDVEAARNAAVAAWAVPHGYNGGRPIAEAQPDRLFADLGAVADFVCAARMAA